MFRNLESEKLEYEAPSVYITDDCADVITSSEDDWTGEWDFDF